MTQPWAPGLCGEQIHLDRPEDTEIHLLTIARALAHQCRWTGRCKSFYSVAEHSLHVCDLVLRNTPEQLTDEGRRRWGKYALLHDAHEAYVGDVVTPVKRMLGEKWRQLESAWEQRVHEHFGIAPTPAMRDVVKWADLLALQTERAYLIVESPGQWAPELIDLVPDSHWTPAGTHAERDFLAACERLAIT